VHYIAPMLLIYVLYKAIRNGDVGTEAILYPLKEEPGALQKFLEVCCGDDDVETVAKFAVSLEATTEQKISIEIMKAWSLSQAHSPRQIAGAVQW
jgi:hypothetical protein